MQSVAVAETVQGHEALGVRADSAAARAFEELGGRLAVGYGEASADPPAAID